MICDGLVIDLKTIGGTFIPKIWGLMGPCGVDFLLTELWEKFVLELLKASIMLMVVTLNFSGRFGREKNIVLN